MKRHQRGNLYLHLKLNFVRICVLKSILETKLVVRPDKVGVFVEKKGEVPVDKVV